MLRKWLSKDKHPFLCKKSKAWTNVVAHSHYNEPLAEEGLRGNSRIWGDASSEVQEQVIALVNTILKVEGFGEEERAFALCLVRCESGFNPDAAAGTTSASGLIQAIDKTRANLANRAGLANASANKFNAVFNCLILVPQLKECFAFAKLQNGNKFEYAYKYHHDGGQKDYGGLKIAKEKVAPLMGIAMEFIK
jgi:putative chitinase